MPEDNKNVVPIERIESAMLLIRGEKVMLDQDIAELYSVETRALVQAVKRNIDRFPADLLFQLSDGEFSNLRSQIVRSSWVAVVLRPMHSLSRASLCSQASFAALRQFVAT